MSLSDAQLAQIAEKIFVMGDPAKTALPKPSNTAPESLTSRLKLLETWDRYQNAGIAVIDFTENKLQPKVWLNNNADTPFRIGSTGKLGMMLAAVQLRLDIRQILDLNIISSPSDFDALFANPKLWEKAKPRPSKKEQIAMQQIAKNPPLISKIFDFTKHPVDFAGPDPDGQINDASKKKIVDKLAGEELSWNTTPPLTFSERLFMAGSYSDNVAATACISEIGVPYIKAVQRSYGLADTAHGMHLLASGDYVAIPARVKASAPPPPRQLKYTEPLRVNDAWWDPGARKFNDHMAKSPGSAAALTAYMLALVGETFVVDPRFLVGGLRGCTTIRNNLSDGGGYSLPSFLAGDQGVEQITKITSQFNKIGILKKAEGAENPIRCEFVYLETKETTPVTGLRSELKYAIIVTGLVSSSSTGDAAVNSAELGKMIHNTLLSL